MKKSISIVSLTVLLATSAARADFSFSVNQDIPDGNPVGLTSVGAVNGWSGGIVPGMSVDLNISGGYNGDLYAYLEAPSGSTVVLLDRPGVTFSDPFGYGGSGFNITLSDAASSSLQDTPEAAGLPFTGTVLPFGNFANLNDQPGNGDWTLFVADLSAGGGQAVLNNWSLNFAPATAPEPGQIAAMALFGLAGLGAGVARRWRRVK